MYTKMNGQQATRARRGYTAVGAVGVAENPSASAGCGTGNAVRAAQGAAVVDPSAAMKECPVCKARCFADMSVCYNCLHSFGSSEQSAAPQISKQPVFDAEASQGSPDEYAPDWHEESALAADGCDLALSDEEVCLPLRAEEGATAAPLVQAAAVPVGRPFGITVNVPEGLVTSCECAEPKQVRPDQLMEMIISIKVAQDASSKRVAATAE